MNKDQIKEHIVVESIKLFLKYGLKSVTMDDIAKNLSMSKKTIYQHFDDKEDIIIQATSRVFEEEMQMMAEIESKAENAVEHLYQQTIFLRERIRNTSAIALHDMKKYYQNAWKKYVCFKQDGIYDSVVRNLNRGISEGLFRKDINPEILAKFRIAQIELSFEEGFFENKTFSLVEIHEQLFEHFSFGILSEEGLKLFKTYKQKNPLHETV